MFLTVLLGGMYPLIVTGFTSVLFAEKSSGGFITYKDHLVGAHLISQEFTGDKFFKGRPSAAHFNGSASSGSNYSLTHPDLAKLLSERKSQGLDYDLLSASGSGLDPEISVKAAKLQISRVAQARNIDTAKLNLLLNNHITKRQWGFLGEERVNVLELNLALEKMAND